MAIDQLQQELEALRAQLAVMFRGQAEILLRLKHPDGSFTEEDIHAQQLEMQQAYQNRPSEEFRPKGQRLL